MNSIYDNHVDIEVQDKSITAESYVEVDDDTLAVLYPLFTSRGRDNKILEFKSPGTFKDTYGDDVDIFAKYGQANLNAMGALRSGARVFGCKLLPTDAKRANVVISVAIATKKDIPQYKRDDTVIDSGGSITTLGIGSFVLDENGAKIPLMVPNSTTPDDPNDKMPLVMDGIQIKLVKKTINTFDTKGVPVFDGKSYKFTDTNTLEWTAYPLFMMYYYGRGVGGNNFGFTINSDLNRDRKVTDGRRYILNMYEYLQSGSIVPAIDEELYFSFNPEALYADGADINEGLLYAYSNTDDNDEERPIQIVNYDNFNTITTAIYPFIGNGTTDDVDFIFAVDEDNVNYGKVVVASDTIDPSGSVVRLAGGSDGSLGVGETVSIGGTDTVVTQEMADTTKKSLLTSFFSCDIDNSIFDEKIIDCDMIVDANYDDDIKSVILSKMPLYRDDISLILDCGFTTSYKEAISKAASLSGYVDNEFSYMAYINGHSGYTKDPTITIPRHVTWTYDFIRNISELYGTPNGRFQMLAGATNGKTKYIKWDWIAEKDKTNMMLKLEKAKCNYIEKINKRGETMYGSETTLYVKENSKLNSLRNSLVIGDAKRVCHKILIKYVYDPRSIKSTIEAATTELTTIFKNRYPSTIGVTVKIYQTKRDQDTDNAHCDIIFVFPNYIKKFKVTIIAKRETAVSTTKN